MGYSIDLLKQTHSQIIEIAEILGRGANWTTTFRDTEGRVHSVSGSNYKKPGDVIVLTIGHYIVPAKNTHDDFMFE